MESIGSRQLPPTPGTGGCVCGGAYYFERGNVIGAPGHFHCRRCGRRYRMYDDEPWTPGAPAPTSSPR